MAVRLSGRLAGAAGTGRLAVEVAPDATVAQVLERLAAAYPGLRDGLPTALPVVRGAHVAPDRLLAPGEEVALLLPAAGG